MKAPVQSITDPFEHFRISTMLLAAPKRTSRNGTSVWRNLLLLAWAAFCMLSTVAFAGTTTTSLAASPNPAYVSQVVALTATVTGTSPTGTVTFKDGTATLGTATLSSGQAVFNTSFTTTGTHSLTVVYGGDAGNSTSTSSGVSLTVKAKTTTTTALASSVNPSTVNQSVTLTATVTGTTPSGTVTFKDGTTTLGTGTISAGKATLATALTTSGSHSLTAVYAGDTANAISTSSALSQTVNLITTTTSLASSASSVYVGQSVTLTATIAGGTNPTGTVTFKDGTATLGTGTVSAGQATLTTSFSTASTHSLTAVYGGDAVNKTSTSGALSEVVKAKTTTTTALASSTNPSTVNQSVTLNATVTGGTPTGTVTFKDGTTTLGTSIISAGKATLATAFASSGSHSLTAVYAGDTANATSTSSALSQTVNLVTTTTTLASSSTTAYASQSITLTATVTGTSPTGTVTFKDGTTTLGTGTVSGGQATLATSFATTGAHSLTAVYGGDTVNKTSTSVALSETVQAKTNSSTTLASSANPAYVSQSVTLTATVTGTNPNGTVTFKDGTTILGTGPLSAGKATFTAGFSTTGSHSLTAVYAGDIANNTSTSTALAQVVNAKLATTTALATSVNPSTINQSVTLTATITGSTPTGTVTFLDGATILGTGTVSAGKATFTGSFTTTGNHSLSASYGGDTANATSTSSTLTQTVSLNTSTTTLTSSANPSTVSQGVTLTATVSGSGPTGTVTFKDGTTTLGTSTIIAGKATLASSFSTTGSHAITAIYGGDAANAASSSAALSQTVNLNTTAATLTSSGNPSTAGQSVTLTATVTGSNPTGAVTFMDGSTTLGTAMISAGQATLSTSFGATGSHSLTAVYGGDATNVASTSTALIQTVNLLSTATTLTSSANPANVAQTVTLTASVSGNNPGGSVTFQDGTTVLGSAALSNGQATLTTNFSAAGNHSLTAGYGGDAFNAVSNSAALNQAINQSTSATTLTASANTVTVGQSVTLTVTVTGTAPTGSVTFVDGSTTLGTATLANGQASLSTSFSAIGDHPLTASYGGDDSNTASTSAATMITVSSNNTVTPPGPVTWLYGYDAMGSPTTVIDPNGNQTTTFYDTLSRPFSIALPASYPGAQSPQVLFTSDGLDQLAQVTDPRNLSTTFTLDGFGNKTAASSPDTGSASATYDAAGNLLISTDARGKTTSYTYDGINRPLSISYSSGTGTTLEYDGGANPTPTAMGHLTKMHDESGSTSYTHDAFGRVLSKTQVVSSSAGTKSLQLAHAWGSSGNAAGKLTAITYPSGMRVNYGYDSAGRINSVSVDPVNSNGVGTSSGSTINVLNSISFNGANNVLGWSWGNGSIYQRGYDGFGRLSTYQLGDPIAGAAAAGLTRTLTYDNGSRITAYTHANATGPKAQFDQGFGYDGQDRLISMTLSATSFGYSYDANGNRTARMVSGTNYVNTVDPSSNRLTQVQMPTGSGPVSVTQSYDAVGNLTGDGTSVLSYNDRGRLSRATVAGGDVSYLHNGLEQRVVKTGPNSLVNLGAVYYAYDEVGHLLGEYDANLVPIYETAYLGDVPVAVIKQDRSTAVVQASVGNVYADQLGAPRVITRSTDNVVLWRWDQAEAFGATPPDQNPSGLGVYTFNQRFPGQVFDAETSTFYNWHRNYRPGTGRYAQPDPVGFNGGLNLYGYVFSNPASNSDPLGLWSPEAHDEILQSAFGGQLSPADISRLQQSSRAFDKAHQGPDESHMHSMRRKQQSAVDAVKMRDDFVKQKIGDARKMAKIGNKNAALDRLGEACHPLMDSSSPMHRNSDGSPATWNPLWPFGHSPVDYIGKETTDNLSPQILSEQNKILRDAYNRVFGK